MYRRRTDVPRLCSRVCAVALAAGCLISSCLAAPAVVNASGGLRLREQASTGAKVVATLSNGAKLDVIKAVDSDWYQVSANGKSGYVSRDFVRFNCTGKVNADTLNLRSGPGTGHSKVTTLSKGDAVTVLSMEQGWYQVSAQGSTGYVSMEYITIDGTQPTPAPAQQQAGKVNTSSLNVRSGPGTGHSKVTALSKGAAVTVLGEEAGWYKISFNGKTGYASKDYITLTADAPAPAPAPAQPEPQAPPADTQTAERFGQVNTGSLNMRTGPSSSHARIKTLSSGTVVAIQGEENGWYRIVVGDETGYVSKQYITVTEQAADTPAQQPAEQTTPEQVTPEQTTPEQSTGEQTGDGKTYGIVSTGSLNIRSGPGSDHAKVGTLSSGKQVELLETLDGWYRIAEGYVSAQYITIVDGSTSALRAQIVAYARQFLGCRYVLGGKGPTSFDCSGLVWYVYKHFGYNINRSATQQLKNGTTITKDSLQPGDLVFFNSAGTGVNKATHVGLYIGDGQFLHASSSKVGVVISDLYSAYYKKVYTTARRIL